MRDFIFIIGASGIGKTTLAKKLYEHYKGTWIETNQRDRLITPMHEVVPHAGTWIEVGLSGILFTNSTSF